MAASQTVEAPWVTSSTKELEPQARALAEELGLLYRDAPPPGGLCLELTPERLQLRMTGKGAAKPIWVNFAEFELNRRIRSGYRKEALARAVGLPKGLRRVIDATAGLGRDSFLLAGWGCEVVAYERSPVMLALLHDGWKRACHIAALAPAAERLTIKKGDAGIALQERAFEARPEVVYIDPMLGHLPGRAQVKKEMQILRSLLGRDMDSESLVRRALAIASQRVVVKRPLEEESLVTPVFAEYGKGTVRFDMYRVNGNENVS